MSERPPRIEPPKNGNSFFFKFALSVLAIVVIWNVIPSQQSDMEAAQEALLGNLLMQIPPDAEDLTRDMQKLDTLEIPVEDETLIVRNSDGFQVLKSPDEFRLISSDKDFSCQLSFLDKSVVSELRATHGSIKTQEVSNVQVFGMPNSQIRATARRVAQDRDESELLAYRIDLRSTTGEKISPDHYFSAWSFGKELDVYISCNSPRNDQTTDRRIEAVMASLKVREN